MKFFNRPGVYPVLKSESLSLSETGSKDVLRNPSESNETLCTGVVGWLVVGDASNMVDSLWVKYADFFFDGVDALGAGVSAVEEPGDESSAVGSSVDVEVGCLAVDVRTVEASDD
ncbi:hypothetical protein DPMN_080419 [Dreissena polymorpha]|uniref:Uncharacterized protein n=1 Tax=Dreissena polymorpha TaxID=45954 RepID=A0A9D3YV05_DREPO|nr:hypothetical protein DPMN_080419 [Dreissena polymorpha]